MTAPINPPAFPSQPYGTDGLPSNEAEPGMALRDWFAGQAVTGMFASLRSNDDIQVVLNFVAKHAYDFADAMLAERERGA